MPCPGIEVKPGKVRGRCRRGKPAAAAQEVGGQCVASAVYTAPWRPHSAWMGPKARSQSNYSAGPTCHRRWRAVGQDARHRAAVGGQQAALPGAECQPIRALALVLQQRAWGMGEGQCVGLLRPCANASAGCVAGRGDSGDRLPALGPGRRGTRRTRRTPCPAGTVLRSAQGQRRAPSRAGGRPAPRAAPGGPWGCRCRSPPHR